MLIGGEQADADWSVRFPSIKEHSGNIPGTFREHSGNIPGTFRKPPKLKAAGGRIRYMYQKSIQIHLFFLANFFFQLWFKNHPPIVVLRTIYIISVVKVFHKWYYYFAPPEALTPWQQRLEAPIRDTMAALIRSIFFSPIYRFLTGFSFALL